MAIAFRANGTFADANSTTTGSIGLPAGLTTGDVLVLVCQSRGASATVTTPSGYTVATNIQITSSHRLHVFYKYVTNAGTEVAPAVVQSVSGAIRARLSAFSGCSSTTQLDVAAVSDKSAAASTVTAPTISPASSGAMVCWIFSSGDDNTLNAATQGTTAYSSDGVAGNDGSIALVYELQGASGAAGTCSMTESVNGPDNWCTVTLALRPTVAAAADPTRTLGFDSITYAMEMAFGDGPFTATPTWTDVSAYVRAADGITVTRGRNSTFSDIQPGTMTFTLDNRLRLFDPDYSAGTYFGKLVPLVRCRLRVRKSSVNYPIFDGYVQGWPQGYSYPREATVQIACLDLMSRLTTRQMPKSLLDLECIVDGAKGHWPLDEDSGGAAGFAFDASGHGADGAFTQSGAVETFLAGEPGRKARWMGWSQSGTQYFGMSNGGDGVGALDLSNLRTVEFWIQIDQFTTAAELAGLGIPFLQIFSETAWINRAVANTVTPEADPEILIECQSEVGLFQFAFENNVIYGGSGGFELIGEYQSLTLRIYDSTNSLIYGLINDFFIGQPMHVVGVLGDGADTLSLYLNGQLVGNVTGLSGTFEGGSREPGISMIANGTIAGSFAHFAAYETALTAAQVRAHYAAGTTGGKNDHPSDRLEDIADFAGLVDASQFDNSDLADHTYLSRAVFSGNVLTAMQDIVRTEQGRMFVDAAGVLQVQGRTADVKDTTVNAVSQATLSDSGSLAYQNVTVDAAELELLRNTIRLSTNGGEVSVYDTDSRALYDEQPESFTALLDDASAARNLGKYRLRQFADPATRISSVTLVPHGAADTRYTTCLSVDLGWRITVTRTPQSIGSAISKVCHVEGIVHHVTERGPWTTTLYLAPAQNAYTAQPWFVLGDATYGKIGTVAGNQLIY